MDWTTPQPWLEDAALESLFSSTPTPGPGGLDTDKMRPQEEGLVGEGERSEDDAPASGIREKASERGHSW